MDDFIKTNCIRKTNFEKAQMIYDHIATVHGPHSNMDAQNLRRLLWDLNPADIKWRNYLTKFTHMYTTLSTMPQLDPDGKPKIGQLPIAQHHPKPDISAMNAQDQLEALKQWIAINEAEETKIKDQYPHGGPVLTFQPTELRNIYSLTAKSKGSNSLPIHPQPVCTVSRGNQMDLERFIFKN
jgi:hypothetical protein